LMTLECMNAFGIKVIHSPDLREYETSKQTYKPTKYKVEGDWSSASYFVALGALCGDIKVESLNTQSLQGDKEILSFLKEMGASVTVGKDSVIVRRSKLKAISVDLTDCIDLLPTMAVLAAVADKTSEFTGIQRARLKESDRVAAVKEGLERMGIKVVEEKNRLAITGSMPGGAIIDTKGDHRIAMAFALLGSLTGGVIIDNAECVAKTYPEFWDILKSTGGEVKLNGK
ncbi:3-phosphoshikimate 1-carboxyvinyltransferase, partial [Chloroflexota bacterium]